ncbi:MAG: heat-inducible transcriptional repressor HrcA [Actinomycetota bacterium]|nr:heat-inducible transcriptional repressor HrcA [Actinomycetota bacterium]
MLDDRKTAILRAVVEEYIATAQPVGSAHIANNRDLAVSSATVRNDMAALEREGYLMHPHTSAGRIPTDKGYRFFVDNLVPNGSLGSIEQAKVGSFFETAHFRLEETLQRTSMLLAQLTNYASVVIGPTAEVAVVRSVQLVRLSSHHMTVVVVLSNGAVENAQIEITSDVLDDEILQANAELQRLMITQPLSDVAAHREANRNVSKDQTRDAGVVALCEKVLSALDRVRNDENFYVGGVAQMAEAFDAVEIVRNVLHTLEQQYVVVTLVRDMLNRGVSVAIGAEHGVEPLSACSVVLAPVRADGETVGTVGVLGPTRMNYPQALATVDLVSDRLGRRLTEN